VFKVKRLVYSFFIALSLQSSFVFGDVYPTDTFSMHKLCISNPWNGTNFKGDATSSFPCHYDYAIVHVPTLLVEQNNQILNTKVVMKLEIDPIDFDAFYINFIDGFQVAMGLLFFAFVLGTVVRFIWDYFGKGRH
jgi:hypothetical protein